MNGHLLAIAVGPVQEFIAAARRTRDLWFGSYVLSEISKAVAQSVHLAEGTLIFPAPAKDNDLERGSDLNVANVILAEIPADKDNPEEIARKAREAGRECWRSFAGRVIEDRAIASVVQQKIWNEQVDDVVEFYAAWTPVGNDYKAARSRVMRLLAGRKNCRDFEQAKPHPGLPKSSLDGMRDTVLLGPRDGENPQTYRDSWSKETRRKLRVRTGEQLDVVGLVKRAAEGAKPYPSVSRVAADPWIRGHAHQLGTVIAECDQLGNSVIRQLDISANGHPHYAAFPFEGTAVFRNRHHELIEEAELDREALRPLANAVARLGEPSPYLAVIVADGDKMGETLAKLRGADEHRAFSAKLAEFAEHARGIVNEHQGVLVYAGGDDVLAFAPVDQCLVCARKLHDKFGELLKEWGEKAETAITLSVGVAIGHFLENLEDLREYGQTAEKDAKTPDASGVKNALAVHLHKRGGGPIKVRARWLDPKSEKHWADSPDTRLTKLAEMLREGCLPTRLATDLNRMADVYDAWPRDDEPAKQRVKLAIERDVLRVIAAKQPGSGGSVGESLRPLLSSVTDASLLRQLAKELLVARQVATALSQAARQGNKEAK